LEKVGLVWKMPGFFFKRIKLDQLRKSRAFSKQAQLFPEKARLFRLKLRAQESIPMNGFRQPYVDWRVGTSNRVVVPTARLEIDSWAPLKVYKFGLCGSSRRAQLERWTPY
jgi:hypothetical protein